jgi:hypothetical protein
MKMTPIRGRSAIIWGTISVTLLLYIVVCYVQSHQITASAICGFTLASLIFFDEVFLRFSSRREHGETTAAKLFRGAYWFIRLTVNMIAVILVLFWLLTLVVWLTGAV